MLNCWLKEDVEKELEPVEKLEELKSEGKEEHKEEYDNEPEFKEKQGNKILDIF